VVNGQETTRLPVYSALRKQLIGGMVVRWALPADRGLVQCGLQNNIRDYNQQQIKYIIDEMSDTVTYDHRTLKTSSPVRSAVR
jgi:hypothetical protein